MGCRLSPTGSEGSRTPHPRLIISGKGSPDHLNGWLARGIPIQRETPEGVLLKKLVFRGLFSTDFSVYFDIIIIIIIKTSKKHRSVAGEKCPLRLVGPHSESHPQGALTGGVGRSLRWGEVMGDPNLLRGRGWSVGGGMARPRSRSTAAWAAAASRRRATAARWTGDEPTAKPPQGGGVMKAPQHPEKKVLVTPEKNPVTRPPRGVGYALSDRMVPYKPSKKNG